MPLAEIASWGGVVVGTLTNLAQARKLARRGTDGVSAVTWSLFTLMSLFWLAYGAASGGTEVVVASIVGLPFLVVLLARLEPAARWRGLAMATAALGAVACVPAAILGWDAGLLGLGVLIVATRLPQLCELVRSDRAHGVSTGSWLLGSFNVALWLTYYAATARTFAAATMAIALTANLAIVALALLRHRVGVPTATPAPVPTDALAMAG